MKRNGTHPSFSSKEKVIGGIIAGTLLAATAAYFLTSKKTENRPNRNLVIGGIAGGILGLSAVAFLTSKSGKDVREVLIHNFKQLSDKTSAIAEDFEDVAEDTLDGLQERIAPWIQIAQDFAGTLNAFVNKRNARHKHSSTIDTVADWAGLGLKLFQSLKK